MKMGRSGAPVERFGIMQAGDNAINNMRWYHLLFCVTPIVLIIACTATSSATT
jgi:hypothetical protein